MTQMARLTQKMGRAKLHFSTQATMAPFCLCPVSDGLCPVAVS